MRTIKVSFPFMKNLTFSLFGIFLKLLKAKIKKCDFKKIKNHHKKK
jgi:hypothetical protein